MKMMHFKNEGGTIKQGPISKQIHDEDGTKKILTQQESLSELNEMLQALESNMEKEINQIKMKYEKKKAPILDAIHTKNKG
jgi:hypothetical protein